MPVYREAFTDAQRVRLLGLAMSAIPHHAGDPELTEIIARLSGVDTVLIAHRAYPSRAVNLSPERQDDAG